jgi:hypothetical protein
MYFDVIIIGSGIAGLYAGYNIKKMSPKTSFVILEKYKKEWIGGRTNNDNFYGSEVVTGAGIGRKEKDKLLISLLNELGIKYKEFPHKVAYSKKINDPVDIKETMNILKKKYNDNKPTNSLTFKEFFIKTLGPAMYNKFIVSSGYTDYENADAFDTLYDYGMEDNTGGWIGLSINWKKLIKTLCIKIGMAHIKTSTDVIKVTKIQKKPCFFEIKTENGNIYHCNKVIIATNIASIQKLISNTYNGIYKHIQGQPFVRVYAKFSIKSIEIMKNFVKSYTIVPGPLQKIIPINRNKGIYMIAYSDNASALTLKPHLENNEENRNYFAKLVEQALFIPQGILKINAIKSYYWPIGTHYYTPLNNLLLNRNQFIEKAQHPMDCMLVVGEVVSKEQGWVEGALDSVKKVVTEEWIKN